MNDATENSCEIYLKASNSNNPQSLFYNNVCYLGRQSIETFKYANFTLLGFKETEHPSMPTIPIIGIDQNKPIAAIVEDSIIYEMKQALPEENEKSVAVVPFIMAVVAIDAALLGTMWAVAVSAKLN